MKEVSYHEARRANRKADETRQKARTALREVRAMYRGVELVEAYFQQTWKEHRIAARDAHDTLNKYREQCRKRDW